MYALDVGLLDELRKKYEDVAGAEGFHYSARFKPAAVTKEGQNNPRRNYPPPIEHIPYFLR